MLKLFIKLMLLLSLSQTDAFLQQDARGLKLTEPLLSWVSVSIERIVRMIPTMFGASFT